MPKVEKSIWTSRQTGKELKESDKQMQRTQLYLTKGLMPLVSIMSKTFETDSEEAEEIFDLALDAFSLLAYSHRDLSTQRKRMLMPAISSKYKGLCGDDTSITANQLFGENLSEQIKKIDKSGKISNKLSKWKNKTYYKSERKESDFQNLEGKISGMVEKDIQDINRILFCPRKARVHIRNLSKREAWADTRNR